MTRQEGKYPNFVYISETIGTAAQPTEDQFAAIRADGYEVVVNLALPDSPGALPNEGGLVTGLGMEYVHIPVIFDAPTEADLTRFFAVLDGYRDRKVFVHCAANWRVSCFVFLYRVRRQGVPLAEAQRTLLTGWPEPDPVWQAFMDRMLASGAE